jgi:hypothetical protein
MKGAANPSDGVARNSRRGNNNSSDDEDNNSSNNESENEDEEVMAASPLPLDDDEDDALPPVTSSSSSAAKLAYYSLPLPPRKERRIFSSSGTRKDEKTIANFTCGICCRLLFRAQALRPCTHNVFCEECVPPLDARASACFTCFTPFEAALPFHSGDNVVDNMVRAGIVKKEIGDEWRSRGADFARERAQGSS